MSNDHGQRTDVAQAFPEVTARLRKASEDWSREVVTGYDDESRPFLVGHPDSRVTQLPARDATAAGNIERSNRFPNCSFFTNWTSLDDRISWDVEVIESGKYEVECYYACPASDVGASIRLSHLGQSVDAEIRQPHDPPLQGAENDRVERIESYVKDFRPMKLGGD